MRRITDNTKPTPVKAIDVSRAKTFRPVDGRSGYTRTYVIHVNDVEYVSNHETLKSAISKANNTIMKYRVGSVLRVHVEYSSAQPSAFERCVVYKIKRTPTSFEVLFQSQIVVPQSHQSTPHASPRSLEGRIAEHENFLKGLKANGKRGRQTKREVESQLNDLKKQLAGKDRSERKS